MNIFLGFLIGPRYYNILQLSGLFFVIGGILHYEVGQLLTVKVSEPLPVSPDYKESF